MREFAGDAGGCWYNRQCILVEQKSDTEYILIGVPKSSFHVLLIKSVHLFFCLMNFMSTILSESFRHHFING